MINYLEDKFFDSSTLFIEDIISICFMEILFNIIKVEIYFKLDSQKNMKIKQKNKKIIDL